MKKLTMILLTGVFIFAGVAAQLDAATVTGTPPTSGNGTLDPLLASAFNSALADVNANSAISKFNNQTDLARGFANASAYASHAGTLQGYQNYDLFFVSVGMMAGVQAPSADSSYYEKSTIEDDLRSDGDIHAGVGASVAINAGIHARFIAYGLYLSGIFGKVKVGDADTDDYEFESTIIGGRINYALIQPHGVLFGLLNWRGLSLGTGFIYQKSKANFEFAIDTVSKPFSGGGFTGTLSVDPTVNFGFETKTYIVPVEVVTSFQLLWILNITLGAGVDFVTGKTDLNLSSAGDVNVSFTSGATALTPGRVQVDGSTRDVSPDHILPKLMAGIGLQLGPIKLDVPVIYYPDAGAAVGITAAFVW